jgi:redox-sensitive bicupin YhaK (pirin superfamily)
VIQIWFLVEDKYRHLPPHYEQVSLKQMPSHQHRDGVVRNIIGPHGATDSHVNARLTSTTITPGGQSPLILPEENEDLFLYVVNGQGHIKAPKNELAAEVGLYDVVLARPEAEAPTFTAGEEPLTYLSFYLPKFLS